MEFSFSKATSRGDAGEKGGAGVFLSVQSYTNDKLLKPRKKTPFPTDTRRSPQALVPHTLIYASGIAALVLNVHEPQ